MLQESRQVQSSIMHRTEAGGPNFSTSDYRKPLAVSLLLHVLFIFLVLDFIRFAEIAERKTHSKQEVAPSLAIISTGDEAEFIPSELMEKALSPPQQSRRISDTDTMMRGEQHRNDLDRADQTGKNADVVVMQDAPESPGATGRIAARLGDDPQNLPDLRTTPARDKSRALNRQEAANSVVAQNTQDPATRTKDDNNTQSNPIALDLPEINLPKISSSTVATTNNRAKKNDRTENQEVELNSVQTSRTAQPPTQMSFRQEKTLLEGRAPDIGAASWDALGTTLGEYQAEIYRRVGENWHRMIRERRSLITYGRVVAQLEVSSTGRITSLKLREWPERGTMLGVVSEASIRRAGPFRAFPENLRHQLGDYMQMELTFVVY
jgi:hypothetical protein